MVHWDADGRKDLLLGLSDGRVELFLNVASDSSPAFDGGTILQVGAAASKADIDVGDRAAPTVCDWNQDGRKDLVVGAYDGKIHVFLNEGTDAAPDFVTEQYAGQRGADLVVPTMRSSPHVVDLDTDGRQDLLTGDTLGRLLFYPNTGTAAAPDFTDSVYVEANGVPIMLAGTRSRPFVTDWTGDGLPDVLLGAGDGKVRLYQGLGYVGVVGPLAAAGPDASRLAAFPNPSRGETTLRFAIPATGPARLTIHDVSGRLVRTLVSTGRPAGDHEVRWDGLRAGGERAAAGLYFVRLETAAGAATRKLVLLR